MRNLNQQQPRVSRKLIIILTILVALYIFLDRQYIFGSELISPIVGNAHFFNLQAEEKAENKVGTLPQIVEKSMEGTQGTYAIVIKNLKTGETYQSDQDRKFDSGSLYKLWVMGTVFQKIKDGSLKEDDLLSEDIATLNSRFDIDPEVAEQTEGTISLTVSQALNQMITISHNYAALLLSVKVRLSAVDNFLHQVGLSDSVVGIHGETPSTTASDTALFLEKLYKGELAESEYTQKMIELLKNQKLNNKLPKYLPSGVVMAHKTGELGWFSHDAGIVYTPKGDYIIVVLSESESPAGAEERIAKLSRDVYEYFVKGGED